jgi:protein-tyrosine-phosphatase/DNA-binding transcriptional ArsR family regulator
VTVFEVLADPRRRRILQELGRSDRRVQELTARLGEPQSLVSYHLRVLREAGLVTSRASAHDRRDTYYRADLAACRHLVVEGASELHPGLRLAPEPPPPTRRGARVLFLCTGNSARSQMAEALLTRRSAGAVSARSAGSAPKALHPLAVAVMAERGIDISANRVKHLRRFARQRFDVVVTLCDRVREVCPELPGASATAHWSMADPSLEGAVAAFERTAQELETRIGPLLAQLATTEEMTHAR